MQLGHSPVGTIPWVYISVSPQNQGFEGKQPISSKHDQGPISLFRLGGLCRIGFRMPFLVMGYNSYTYLIHMNGEDVI